MPVNLEGTGRGGNPMSVQENIDTYCPPGTQKKGTCVPISQITRFLLQVMVSMVTRIAGSPSLHLRPLGLTCELQWHVCKTQCLIGFQV